ncbi:MAG TPA: AMP-binding protein [Labilithrix sp.]
MHHHGKNGSSAPATPIPPLDIRAQMEGARLLLLGGTGFLGKIFWVLLLARYPEIGRIFLLTRKSATKTSEERFWSEVATNEAMKPLRDQHGDGFEAFLRSKIAPIDGDVGLPLCGIDEKLVKELRGSIDAVVNVAGVVDFNPPLDEALDTNAFGAQNLVALAKALGDAPLMHTSTCYVVGNRDGLILEETPGDRHPFPRAEQLGRDLWDPAREIADCLDLVAQAKSRCEDGFRQSVFLEQATKNLVRRGEPTAGAPLEKELESVKRKFVADRLVEAGLERATHWGWPNIYTYTKSIGEQIIAKSGLPFTIARPACCESTIEFPFPAWNEGIGTSAPIIFLAMKGHHQLVGRDAILDFIPADMVCAGMVLTLAELLEGTQKPVYQYGASDTNPGTSERFGELIGLYKRKYYTRRGKGNPFVNFLQAYMEPAIVDLDRFEAFGPGAIARAARGMAKVLKSAPGPAAKLARPAASTLESVARQEEKIDHILHLFAPFTWDQKGPFSCANTRAAFMRLSPEERQLLPWWPEKIDWADYWMNQHMPAMEKRVIPWMDERYKKKLEPLRAHETLATLVDQMAERHEHALAFGRLENDGIARITFADVRARADACVARLQALGVGKGDRVVLSSHNHPDWPIAFFGIVRAGATAVPIDPALGPAQFGNVVRESEAKVVLWDEKVDESCAKSFEGLHRVRLDAITAARDSDNAPANVVRPDDDDVASLIYTSGTTGKPKGVMLTHANFTSLVAALAPLFPLGERDRVVSVLPLHHTFEFTCGMLLPFSRGARVVYLDELKGDRLGVALKQARATAMVGVPAVWQLLERRILSQVSSRGPIAEKAFSIGAELNRMLGKTTGIDLGKVLFGQVHDALGGNIRWLISGGAALPKDTQKLFAGLGFKLTEGYGLTEAAPVLTVAKPGSPAGQVGKPIPGVTIKIDSPDEHGVGEVLAKGPNVMAGYTDVEETKLVLEDGWLRTGDLGKLDRDGRLVIVGRVKDVIVTSTGENVYPDDVERMLGKVPHVLELAIVGVTGRSGGERVGCIAVPEADDAIDRAARLDRANKSLREVVGKLPYGKQPTIIHLYDAPLPRTATRKVKRNEARKMLERMIQATARPEDGEAPTSPVRVAIAAVRGKKASEIHGDMTMGDELGFDSLALTELLVALEAKYGAVDPKALQTCRTVADVENLVGTERASMRPQQIVRSRYAIEGKKDEKKDDVPALPEPLQEQAKKLIGRVQDVFYGGIMRSKVGGRAFIPHNRNTIVVANHASHLDMGLVRHALGKYGEDIVTLAAQDYFFEKGTLQRAYFENFTNLKAVDRKAGLRASERQAGEILTQGKTMLIFPEGTRSTDSDVHEFKPLLGHLALTYAVDILPVYLGGTRDAMPKGGKLPTSRNLAARIGPAITVADMRRLTNGLSPADAAREVAKLARRAVVALKEGQVLDVARLKTLEEEGEPKEHPLVTLFAELEKKFDAKAVEQPVSFYFTLGSDAMAKWTVRVSKEKCEVKPGKPEGGTADCVLKTSPEIFTRIVRDAYTPSPAEFLSGAIKSNDVGLLMTFQKVFQLGG